MPVCSSCGYQEEYNFCRMCGTPVKYQFNENQVLSFHQLKDRIITDNMRDLITVVDQHGHLIYNSPSHLSVLGYLPTEEGQSLNFSVIHPDDIDQIRHKLNQVFSLKVEMSAEYRLLKDDGSYIWVEGRGIPSVKDNQVTYVVITARDIQARKEAEEHLKQSEIRHRLILSHTHDLICVVGIDGCYEYASPSYQYTLGLLPCSLIGKDVLLHVHEDDHTKVATGIENMKLTKTASTFHYRNLHANGTSILLEGKGVPIVNDGKVEGFVFVSRDITEQRKLEEMMRNAEKLSAIGELAASIAHEIRNPLTTIKGFLQLFSEEYQSAQDIAYRRMMQSEIDQIEQIVNEFMSLAKQEVRPYEPIDLLSLLKDVTKRFSQAFIHQGIKVVYEYNTAHGNFVIHGQPHQLKLVFIHVIQNAIDAMPLGGQITVSFNKINQQHVTIQIMDNGCGMDADRIKKIGQPFYTTKEHGVGLGLTICNKVILEHKGTLSVTSMLQEGTTIDVMLPITHVEANSILMLKTPTS
ncbi:PAS domain S-box protein [Priestia flexa]|uniref:PAS domain-containing sensor histidine kinase n=1 Tax=Priestia flexa TaxID=86664 RepID=UPI0024C06ED8|nr:PAS domain-containing sensor histidine kinase [Priestia flexa]WHX77957.1 PAS domain S-box protein [Priestia flexa]